MFSNHQQQNTIQHQTGGSLQQEAVLALRDPPLQQAWPAQHLKQHNINPVNPNFAGTKAISTFVLAEKYHATADRW